VKEEALRLRDQGLGYKKIGATLGVSEATAHRLVDPAYAERQRISSRVAKQRRTGTCRVCGTTTRYNGAAHGGLAVSDICNPCAAREVGAAKRGHGPMIERALAILDGKELRFTEISHTLRISNGYTAQLLHRLRTYGLIERPRRGVYRKTAP
jgi:hypothetical protein